MQKIVWQAEKLIHNFQLLATTNLSHFCTSNKNAFDCIFEKKQQHRRRQHHHQYHQQQQRPLLQLQHQQQHGHQPDSKGVQNVQGGVT